MEIKSFPNNRDEYIGAEEVMRWLHGRTSGVFGAADNAAVSAAGGMTVSVSDGTGWITNADGDGVVWWISTNRDSGAAMQLTVPPADSAMDRIDRIIVEWKTTGYADLPAIRLLEGTASINASPPALTNNSTVRQISLARISVSAGTTTITAQMITDERLDPDVCGLVTEQVKIDTSIMQSQFSGLLAGIEAELAELEAGTSVEIKKLTFSAINVPTSAWSANGTYEDYPYRASVTLLNVVASMIPQVVFSVAALTDIDFAPVCECYNGGVYIYADSIPPDSISIPTIICWRR